MDAPRPLHEQLLLLVVDPSSGEVAPYAERALAGSLILDLANAGLVRMDSDALIAPPAGPLPAGILGQAAQLIAGEATRRAPAWWIAELPGKLQPFLSRVAQQLVAQGVLTEERRRRLGLIPTTRFPVRDPAPREALRERLGAVLAGRRAPELADAALLRLLDTLGLLTVLVDKRELGPAQQRARELGQSQPLLGAAGQAVQDAQVAVMVAVLSAATTNVVIGTTIANNG